MIYCIVQIIRYLVIMNCNLKKILLNHFAVQLKLTPFCKSAVLQKPLCLSDTKHWSPWSPGDQGQGEIEIVSKLIIQSKENLCVCFASLQSSSNCILKWLSPTVLGLLADYSQSPSSVVQPQWKGGEKYLCAHSLSTWLGAEKAASWATTMLFDRKSNSFIFRTQW